MEELRRLIEGLDRRLRDIEDRISRLESGRVVLDERKVSACEGEFGGKTYIQLRGGGIIKEVRIPVCDVCGRKSEDFNVCACGRKLCDFCSIIYRNRVLCVDCLSEILPLTKQDYKVLVSIANNVDGLRDISRVTRIRREDVRMCRDKLLDLGLIERRGFSLFSRFLVTDFGLEAVGVYRQVYGGDDDIIQFDLELRGYLHGEEG